MTCVKLAIPELIKPISITDAGVGIIYDSCCFQSGHRYQRFYSASSSLTSWSVTYDFFATRSVDYFLISRANLMPFLSTITLLGSNDNISYSTIAAVSAPFSFIGETSSDFFHLLSSPAVYRYFRVALSFSTNCRVSFNKILLGNLFDFGVNPSTEWREKRDIESFSLFTATTNKKVGLNDRLSTLSYSLKFEFVKDQKVREFLEKMLIKEKRFLFLYSANLPALFNDKFLLQGICSSIKITPKRKNINEITFNFLQEIG